jgi:hypothetical protein
MSRSTARRGERGSGRRSSGTHKSPNSGIAVSTTVPASCGIGERACFDAVAGVAEVLAGGPIRGDVQAHLAVPCVAERSPGATPGAVLVRTNGRSVWGDRRRPGSQTAKRKRGSVYQRHLRPRRSGTAEGVGAGRRPGPVQIADSGRCGPFSGLQSLESFAAAPTCVRARPVVRGRRSAVARSPCAHRFANPFPCPFRRDSAGMAAFAIRVGVALAVPWRGGRPAAATHSPVARLDRACPIARSDRRDSS